MAPYRNYDYGLRGAPETTPGRFRDTPRPLGFERVSLDRPGHVTARLNRDYLEGEPEDRYPRSYRFFDGDRSERTGDERWYRRSYTNIVGFPTLHGAPAPVGYDFSDYGPNQGGRYPDEI